MKQGYFGKYGGSYVSAELKAELDKVWASYKAIKKDKAFVAELNNLRADYQGRPTPLYFCKKLTEQVGGAEIWLKREDLNHTGAHKINHCLGEALLAKYMGKDMIIGETGAGQHGLALATAAALIGLKCVIFMGAVDVEKQFVNVQKMRLLGADVREVNADGQSLKEAVDSAFEFYSQNFSHALYCIGSVVGPHPFPTMVADFQSVVGKEARKQFLAKNKVLPDAVVACVGGGSNAIGIFKGFLDDESVALYGVEASGDGHGHGSASITYGQEGVLHGFKSLVLQKDGKVEETDSVASGLDYPSVGPEHAFLRDVGRARYGLCSDTQAINAFLTLTKTEGIIPALESSHAVGFALELARQMGKGKKLIVNLSGRGDKDVDFVLKYLAAHDMSV